MRRRYLGALVLLSCPVLAFGEYVNFRDPALSAVDGQASYTLSKASTSMLLHAEPDGAVLSWSEQGGIGVRDACDDYAPLEIGGREVFAVAFPSRVTIQSVSVRNLYNMGNYLQTGWYELDRSGNWIPFKAAEDQQLGTDGELTIDIAADATAVAFAAPGWERRQTHEMSVAGMEFDNAQVPEPASVLIFAAAMGLAALGRARRRFLT